MKNINYHRTPLDKIREHETYCANRVGKCPYINNPVEMQWYKCPLRDLCFNAWLHSNREGEGK